MNFDSVLLVNGGDEGLKFAKFLQFFEFGERLHFKFFIHLGFVVPIGATFVTALVESVVTGEKFDIGELFLFFEKELAHVFGGMNVGTFLMVDFAAFLASLEIVIEFIGLFAVGTYFRVEFFASTPQAETEVFSYLSSVVVLFVNEFFICLFFFFFQGRTPALIEVTCTTLYPTISAHVVLVALSRTTVMLHANFAVENDVAVPVVVVTEFLLDWAFVSLDHLLNLE
jgi:hypothetical protein